jgi:hypothetical protein
MAAPLVTQLRSPGRGPVVPNPPQGRWAITNRSSSSLDSDLVRGEILKLRTKTLFADFAVDKRGCQISQKAVTVQWQDSSPVLVWPDEAATGQPRLATPPWSGR